MQSTSMVVMIGATGLIGANLLSILIVDARIQQIVVLSRTLLKLQHPKITNHVIDFNDLANLTYNLPQAAFISCLGTTMSTAVNKKEFRQIDYQYNYDFAKLAEKNQSQKYILVSSIGASENSLFFYSRIKGELESHISKLHLTSIAFLQPSLLLGQRKEFRFLESITQKIAPYFSALIPSYFQAYKPIHAVQVASFIHNLLSVEGTGIQRYSFESIKMAIKRTY